MPNKYGSIDSIRVVYYPNGFDGGGDSFYQIEEKVTNSGLYMEWGEIYSKASDAYKQIAKFKARWEK